MAKPIVVFRKNTFVMGMMEKGRIYLPREKVFLMLFTLIQAMTNL